MTSIDSRLHDEVIDAIDWTGVRHIVDVGGNHGAFLAAILQRLPTSTGVLFDQPQVVCGAGATLDAAGVADRVDVTAGDFFVSVPPGGDVYLVANVLWNWSEEKAGRILRRCREVMAKTARLIICEAVIPDGSEPHTVWLNNGRTRSAGQWQTLLEDAGFTLRGVTETPMQSSVIEAQVRSTSTDSSR